jgi:hypothetical protein
MVQAEPMVVNGDFEMDTVGYSVWPGYVGGGGVNPANISGWTGDGGRGINPISSVHDSPAPFRDNGNNMTHIAFLQGAAFIEQEIGDFTVGGEYVLSLDFNSRNCCGDFPVGVVSLDGMEVASSADLFPPPGSIPPVGGTNPWYHADIPFTATESAITLRISTSSAAGGDSTLIVDNVGVSVVPEPTTAWMTGLVLAGLALRSRRSK